MKSLGVIALLCVLVAPSPIETDDKGTFMSHNSEEKNLAIWNNQESVNPRNMENSLEARQEEWFTEVIVTDEQINFGNGYPWDMVRALGSNDLNSMCPPSGPRCEKRRPKDPFKSTFTRPKGFGTDEHDVYPEIEESAYSNEEERNTLLEVLGLAWQNFTMVKEEPFVGNADEIFNPNPTEFSIMPQSYGPTRITARRRSTSGAYGANLELKFVVVGGPWAEKRVCETLNYATAAAETVTTFVFPDKDAQRITKILGVVAACCSSSQSKCMKKASKALGKIFG